MTPRQPPAVPAAAGAVAGAVLAAAFLAGSAYQGPATPAAAAARTGQAPPACTPTGLVAEADLVRAGDPVTALAGAVLLRNVTDRACTLQGAPLVTVSASGGGAVPVVEQRTASRRAAAVVLGPGSPSGPGSAVGVSVTWSDWSCAPGSFSLGVRFAGWSRAVEAPYGTTAGYTGTPCTSSGSQTLYVGPVARAGR